MYKQLLCGSKRCIACISGHAAAVRSEEKRRKKSQKYIVIGDKLWYNPSLTKKDKNLGVAALTTSDSKAFWLKTGIQYKVTLCITIMAYSDNSICDFSCFTSLIIKHFLGIFILNDLRIRLRSGSSRSQKR